MENVQRQPLPDGLVGWMMFVAVVTIVLGGLNVLSCVGIVTGAFMLVAGFSLLAAKNYLAAVSGVEPSLAPFFDKLKGFFLWTGVMYIVGIVVTALLLMFYFSVIVALVAAGLESGSF